MMGKLWCAALPMITATTTDRTKPVTFIYPFYRNANFLMRQCQQWWSFGESLRSSLSAIVVDDGSPQPASECLGRLLMHPFAIRVFRIVPDVRWNWLAARNIGAHHAADGWLLLTDMDHVIPAETAQAVVTGQHDPGVIYGFSRVEHTGEVIQPHPNSWLMTRAMFWKVGGYDETLSGHYGTDGDWRRRCAAVAPIQILTDRLVRHEYDGDSSTRHYQRKQPIDAAVGRLVKARGKGWRPKVLSFPYHEEQIGMSCVVDGCVYADGVAEPCVRCGLMNPTGVLGKSLPHSLVALVAV